MTRQEKTKALVEMFADKSYGEVIDHFTIAAVIEERYGTLGYGYVVEAAKKELLDSGKMIRNVRKVGYQVVPPDDYTAESVRRITRGAKQIDKGVKVLENAPVKDMTQDGVQRYNTIRDRTCILQASIHGAKVEIKMLSAKRTNPLLEAMNA